MDPITTINGEDGAELILQRHANNLVTIYVDATAKDGIYESVTLAPAQVERLLAALTVAARGW